MPTFSKQSLDILDTCDYRLRDICNEVIKVMDITVICGHRNEVDQNKAVKEGKSKVVYPNSKHNTLPSYAVDIVPYPVDWKDRERFILLAGLMTGIGLTKGYTIRWGGAWSGLKDMKKNKFDDLPHFEIID